MKVNGYTIVPGAYLRWANLRGADLRGADLRWADLSRASLRGTYLTGADLRGADLIGVDLTGAFLSGADLRGADLSGANLRGAFLSGADLPKGLYRSYSGYYEVTYYPDGRLSYGCETHQIEDWPGLVDELCARHEPDNQTKYRTKILNLIETLNQGL